MSEPATLAQPVIGHFEVTRAKNAGTKPNPHGGELVKWYVGLQGEGHEFPDVYWQRKTGSEVSVGDRVYGKVEDGQYGLRFKREQQPDGGGGGGSRSASKSREWKPESAYDPEKVARISRAHAQGMAVQTLTAMGVFEGKSAEQLHSTLKTWIDWFQADVDKAAAKAAQGAGVAPSAERSAPPAHSASPAPAQNDLESRGFHERLSTLLEAAGVNSAAAQTITNYALEEMSVEEQDAAIDRLQNPNLCKAAVDRLTQRTEEFSGASLPSAPADVSIPF